MPPRPLKTCVAIVMAIAALALPASSASAGFLVSNNYNDQQLASLSIGADGLLTPVPGSPFQFSNFTEGFSITPDGNFIVESFGFDNRAGSFALSPGGAISQAQAPFAAEVFGTPPITPDGRFAYLLNKTGGVTTYRLGPDGSMSAVGAPQGSGNGDLPAITPNGRYLFMPDYSGGSIERFAIQSDGTLASLGTTTLGAEGARAIRITPDGRFAILFVDPSGRGSLRSFAIGDDGSLTEIGTPLETTGDVGGPPTISPDGRFVFQANGNEESITTYSIGPNGALSQVGSPAPTGLSQPEGVGMSVDGRFLYAEPQGGQKIQAFAVGADGGLTKIGEPAPTGGFSDGVHPTARPSAPVASFTTTAGPPNGITSFDASASSDTWAKIVSYRWDFGDGTSATTPTPKTSHSYAQPGIYTVRLSLVDDNGCSGFSYTGQTAYCAGRNTTGTVDTLPAIVGIKVTPAKIGVASASKRGKAKKPRPVIHYKLTENASVSFTVLRKLRGHRAGKTCKPSKGKGKKAKPNCTLLKQVGPPFSATGKAGKNKRALPLKLKGRRLKPGAYMLSATATDSAGGKSAPRTAPFKVAKPKVG